MRVLHVIHLTKTKGLPAILEEQVKMEYWGKTKLDAAIETCVYGTKSQLESINLNQLYGLVYTLPAEDTALNPVAESLQNHIKQQAYDVVVFAQDEQANPLSVLLGALSGYPCITNVVAVGIKNSQLLCSRLAYNNNLLAQYTLPLPCIISENLPLVKDFTTMAEPIHLIQLAPCNSPAYIVEQQVASTSPIHTPSPLLLAVGMGVTQKQHLEQIRNFSLKNGFDFGVTRPVAMRGWADIGEIIGVSGSTLAPKLTVTLGISGAAAFYVGIEKSEYILSINADAGAVILPQSDAAIVDNYENVLDGLFRQLSQYPVKEKADE